MRGELSITGSRVLVEQDLRTSSLTVDGVVSTGGAVQGASLTDGTATISGGAITGATTVTTSGAIECSGIFDGAAVGFMAGKTADQTNAAAGDVITFDTVVTNVGGGYDSATSTFTAPHAGLYHLSAVVLSDDSGSYGVTPKLYKNGAYTKIVGYSTGMDYYSNVMTSIHEQAILTAVLELQQGDAMTIVNGEINDDIFGASDNYHTHFEGHLINRM